jgi:hypothetical protein
MRSLLVLLVLLSLFTGSVVVLVLLLLALDITFDICVCFQLLCLDPPSVCLLSCSYRYLARVHVMQAFASSVASSFTTIFLVEWWVFEHFFAFPHLPGWRRFLKGCWHSTSHLELRRCELQQVIKHTFGGIWHRGLDMRS